jgi:hypothetical protein
MITSRRNRMPTCPIWLGSVRVGSARSSGVSASISAGCPASVIWYVGAARLVVSSTSHADRSPPPTDSKRPLTIQAVTPSLHRPMAPT